MKKYTSSIERLGIVNSGMFNQLELNLDVQAIHLVGQNNVGKTSLIALIQFLYFHDVKEMTFSKSSTESLAFYFRREGSYLLFQVLTTFGSRRTVGIYGEGTALSRKIFVFDGTFKLEEFMDAEEKVIPLQQVKANFFDRNLRIYDKFSQYQQALLGQHPDASLNVPMFEMTPTNFGLLRKLLQGLLRLERLTSNQVKEFLINIVQTGGIKTEINIARDFESRSRDLKKLQNKLRELEGLRPIIENWQSITNKISDTEKKIEAAKERLYHISTRYLDVLHGRSRHAQSAYRELEAQHADFQAQRDREIGQLSHIRHQCDTLKSLIDEFKSLESACQSHSKIQVQRQRDHLIAERVRLEEILATIQPEDLNKLRRQLAQKKHEESNIRRQMENLTLAQLWAKVHFSSEEQALLKFLLSEKLISLPISVVTKKDDFLAACKKVTDFLDEFGTFRAVGLAIPKSEWLRSSKESVSLAERLEEIEQQIKNIKQKIEIAEDREQTEHQLQEIGKKIIRDDRIVRLFERLEEIKKQHQSLLHCQERLHQLQEEASRIDDRLHQLKAEMNETSQATQRWHTTIEQLQNQIRSAKQIHQSVKPFDTLCPLSIELLGADDLEQEQHQSEKELQKHQSSLKHQQNNLERQRTKLEAVFDGESSDSTFEQWIEQKLDIANEIERFDEQLEEQSNNLISLVKGEMDRLIRAFEAVQAKVADLNQLIRKVAISNIEQITLNLQESDLFRAIKQTTQTQLNLFSFYNTSPSTGRQKMSQNMAVQQVDGYLSAISHHEN